MTSQSKSTFTFPMGTIQITMDGKQAVRLMRDIGTEVMVPIHFESWDHFKEDRQGLEKVFTDQGVIEKIRWTEPGCPRRIF